MEFYMHDDVLTAPPVLESASPDVKRYQRLKITVAACNTIVALVWLALLGIVFGPELAKFYPDERWSRLLASAVMVGVTL